MLRWLRLAAVCGAVLVWSNEAFAVVQNTDVVVTKPAGETGTVTLTLTQKDSNNQPVKKSDTVRIARTEPRGRQTVRIDRDIAKTVDITIKTDKGERTVSVDVTRLLGGEPVDLGEGFSAQGTPRTAVIPSGRGWRGGTPSRSGFRIAENETPRPMNRIFLTDSTFMPRFNVGFAGGGTNIGGGGGDPLLVSLDTFGGNAITNTRGVNTPGPQGTFGFFGTMEVPLAGMPNAGGIPGPNSFFVRSGALFPTDGEVTTPFNFTGTTPLGAGNVTVKDSASVPLLFGFGFPVSQHASVQIGGGGFFTSRETTITVREAGAAGTPAFSNSVSQSFFDPALLIGGRVGIFDLNNDGRRDVSIGVDGIIRWKQDGDPLVLQSPNFATQKYTVEANRGGTDLSILGSLNVDLGVIFSDIRLKRDIARVGTLDNGLPLYRYKYLWSDQVFVGVMAQEVADVAPDAVVKGDDGYLRVNYAQLGTSMKPWEQWSAERGWLSREAN
jgi:hypothetical protein